MNVPQHRSVVMAPNGIVATGHYLASAAGLEVLLNGGNAVDAAFTAAGVLGVIQPMMSGLGGDSFVIYYERAARKVWAVNGSGPAPRALTLDYLRQHHGGVLPNRGMLSVGVPGAVDVMATAVERWGSGQFDLPRILAPAIRYAEEGSPVAEKAAAHWASARDVLARFDSSRRVLLSDGEAYQPGQWFRNPEYGQTLRRIAEGGRDVFYRGEIARRIGEYSRAHAGLIDEDDLADFHCDIYEPIATDYRGVTVYSTAPPSQGAILLEELNLAEGYDLAAMPWGGARPVHLLVEAKKLAFADRNAYLADPKLNANPLDVLLSKEYAARRRRDIDANRALETVPPGALPEAVGDTTYLCTADRDGNLVSLITSLSAGFGSGEVIEGTGMALNNRVGRGFPVDPNHINVLAPGKRTMHTLLCYMAFRGDQPYLVGGTPGGDGQPQTNLQALTGLIDWGMNVQQAIEAPRWVSFPGTDPAGLGAPFRLRLESGFPEGTAAELERLGHRLEFTDRIPGTGMQIIQVDPERGAYHGGSDPRMDSAAVGY